MIGAADSPGAATLTPEHLRIEVEHGAADGSGRANSSGRTPHLILIPWLLLGIGALLRLFQYFADRPLWYDEAMLTNNILTRSVWQLAAPLSENQVAPLGFLWAVKTATAWLGSSEAALRLVPLVAGLASLVLFWKLADRSLSRPAAWLALALFAVSPRLVYYSAEVKQYSTDVLAVVAILLVAGRPLKNRNDFLLLTLVGCVAVWFSQPAVFVLVAAATTHTVLAAHRGEMVEVRGRVAVGSAWAVSFLLSYSAARTSLDGSTVLASFWSDGFLPLPPSSTDEIHQWLAAFARPFRDPLFFTIPPLAIVGYAAGVIAWLRNRDIVRLGSFVLPVLATMGAAGMHLYPYGDSILFGGRVLLFLAPLLLLTIAHGTIVLAGAIRMPPLVWVMVIVVGFTMTRVSNRPLELLHASVPAARAYVHAPVLPPFITEYQDPRPVLRDMAEETRPGDMIYVYTIAGPTFRYYAPRLGVAGDWVRGSASGNVIRDVEVEMELLRGMTRVWVFFAYAHGNRAAPFLERLDEIGVPILEISDGGVVARLYDLPVQTATAPDQPTSGGLP
jgi:hypothetical protein